MRRCLCCCACFFACTLLLIFHPAFAQTPGKPAAGSPGATDIITALTLGDPSALKDLLAAGADPNAFNPTFKGPMWLSSLIMGQKSMFWAMSDASKLSVGPGASGRRGGAEALAIASARGYRDVVEFLIERGVDVNSRLNVGTTSILVAASNANGEIVQALIGRHADVNLADQHGDTPLMAAVRAGSSSCVTSLLSAGAKLNASDKLGRTAVWWVSRTDRVDILEQLIKRGADLNVSDKSQFTPLMLANRMGQSHMVQRLRRNGASGRADRAEPRDVRSATAASLPLIQNGVELWLKRTECDSCHHTVAGMQAMLVAKRYGLKLDEKMFEKQRARYRDNLRNLDRQVEPAIGNRIASSKADDPSEDLSFSLGLIPLPVTGLKELRDESFGNIALVLANLQFEDGRWIHGMARVPIESSDSLTTAYAIRTLQLHTPAPEKARIERQIARAIDWLEHSRPLTTDDLIGQLYGLFWASRDRKTVFMAAKQLLRDQNEDGSWAQKRGMNGDAYATGEALFALYTTRQLDTGAPSFKRGVAYLLRTQEDDGSWLVPTRAIPLNGYLESGSPHGKHQFISYTATCWSTMVLIVAADVQRHR